MQVQGLDDLSTQLQEDLEKWQKELAQNLQMASDTITQAINNTGASISQITNALNEILGQFKITNNDLNKVGYTVGQSTSHTKGFAKGTKRVGSNMQAFTMEDGREMIFTKNGILTQLKPDDAVMNNRLTESFFKAAEAYPMMEKMFSKMTNSPSQITSNTNEVIAPNINCPITINGSGLSKEEIQTVLDGFIPKISKTVQNDIRKDLKKSGR